MARFRLSTTTFRLDSQTIFKLTDYRNDGSLRTNSQEHWHIMGDFFKPWRRKLGVLTLLMACVFAAGWVRSFRSFEDLVSIHVRTDRYLWLLSSREGLTIAMFPFIRPETKRLFMSFPENWCHYRYELGTRKECSFVGHRSRNWLYSFYGFELGSGYIETYHSRAMLMTLPYPALVLSLTTVSAYLLLSKPTPPSKPKESH